jgi:hypothetical protein
VKPSRRCDLDHVALAVRDAVPPRDRLISELGATLVSGGDAAGFRAMQIRLGDLTTGMTVELLEPWNLDRSDFLVRFLDRHGDGPHHLTFKVPDLAAELKRLEEIGLHPVGVDLSDANWREAFLHPRDSHGTVIQLAESEVWRFELAWDAARAGEPAGRRWWPEPPPLGSGGIGTRGDGVFRHQADGGFFHRCIGRRGSRPRRRCRGAGLARRPDQGGGRAG